MDEGDIPTRSARFRYARESSGYSSQTTFGEALGGVAQSTVSGWETDDGIDIAPVYYKAIERETGIPARWLREGGPTPSISPPQPRSRVTPPVAPYTDSPPIQRLRAAYRLAAKEIFAAADRGDLIEASVAQKAMAGFYETAANILTEVLRPLVADEPGARGRQ